VESIRYLWWVTKTKENALLKFAVRADRDVREIWENYLYLENHLSIGKQLAKLK
jgi:hypothetical protein